ncbi:Rho N domain containing protein, partial [Asbolus verrucosus]
MNNNAFSTLIGSSKIDGIGPETKARSVQNQTLKELKKIAKEKSIKGYSKMNKSEFITKNDEQPFAFEDDYFTEFSDEDKSTRYDAFDIIQKKIIIISDDEIIETIKKNTCSKQGELLNIVVNHDDFWHPISTWLRSSDIDID